MTRIKSGHVQCSLKTGVACLGALGEVIGNCILPANINNNIGMLGHAEVKHGGKVIGKIKNHKIEGGRIFFLIYFNENQGLEGLYSCTFRLSKLFSAKNGHQILLEEVIVESIEINESVYIEN